MRLCPGDTCALMAVQLILRVLLPVGMLGAALTPGQQQGHLVLDEVQQLNGVGHPQHQRLQAWDQLGHAERTHLLRVLFWLHADAPAGQHIQQAQLCTNLSQKLLL